MNEILSDYISKKEKEQEDIIKKEKEEFLIAEGLYQKVYPDKDSINDKDEYPYYEWDAKERKNKNYKKVPIEITDSEYEHLKQFRKPTQIDNNQDNTMANVLRIVGYFIFILGFVAGIAAANVGFTVAIVYWISSFISGILVLGIAEIIKLLNEIKNKYTPPTK